MKKIRPEQQLLVWFAAGILIGTVLCNRMFASTLVNYQILHERLNQGWLRAVNPEPFLIWKTIIVRLLETFFVIVLARSRAKRIAVSALSVWAGICAAALLTIFTWSRGLTGFLCFLASVFPHMLFYLMLWGIVILRYSSPYEVRKGRFWSAVLFLEAAGLTVEILINPWFLRFLI